MRKRKEQTGLRFQTAVEQKTKKSRKGLIIFLAIVLVLAGASAIALYNEYGDREDAPTVGIENKTGMKRKINVLFAGVDENDNVVFAQMITANTSSGKFWVTGLTPKGEYKGQTYQEIYEGEDSGDADTAPLLAEAIAKANDLSMDRYVILPEDEAGPFMDAVGYYVVDFDNDINYEDEDFEFKMIRGEHTLAGSEFFNYLRYVGLGYSPQSIEAQSEVMADFLSTVLNSANAAKGQTIFEELADVVQSDINISDFARYQDFLAQVSEDKLKITVKDVEDS